MEEIDFVILWVDGTDQTWRQEFLHYAEEEGDKRTIRYREWENLQYIFRAFERFTPWVRKIHFVTWGHLPKWLNTGHPKLNVVRHEEYLDEKCLPVFNTNPIEIAIHRIKGLAEKFVFFNDDFFLLSPIRPERFFLNGLPRDRFVANIPPSPEGVGYFVLNAVGILNEHLRKNRQMRKHFLKWFHPYPDTHYLRHLYLMPWPKFTGFYNHHQPQPFLKKTFEELWELEPELLAKTMESKFRRCTDLSQYLFRYWQLAKGEFVPHSMRDTRYVPMTMEMIRSGEISRMITERRYAMLSLNDTEEIGDGEEFEEAKRVLREAFERILPEKSSFEL